MILRADHVAGAAFIALGVVVFAISGDLPFGTPVGARRRHDAEAHGRADDGCSRPLIVSGAGERGASPASTGAIARHAALRRLVTAAAVALYRPLGFLITMALLVFALLVVVERRNAGARRGLQRRPHAVRLLAVRQGAQVAARTRPALVLTPWKPSTACCSAFRSRCGPTCCGTPSSAAWSARWSACCRASARSPASASCCR